MNSADCYTVICRFHAGIDACDAWSEFAVVVDGIGGPAEAAVAACNRLVIDNGGRAEASMVIAGIPDLHFPEGVVIDSEDDAMNFHHEEGVISYRQLN